MSSSSEDSSYRGAKLGSSRKLKRGGVANIIDNTFYIQKFVGGTVAVLSVALLAWFGLSENSPINRSNPNSKSDSSPSDTSSSKDRGLQSFSNDIHFYGEVGSPNDAGGKYVLFRKDGNTLIGLEYIQNSGHPTCFKGTIDQDSIVNVTYASPPEPGTNGTFWNFTTQGRLNLLATYPYSLNDVTPSENVAINLRECVQVFSNANYSNFQVNEPQ